MAGEGPPGPRLDGTGLAHYEPTHAQLFMETGIFKGGEGAGSDSLLCSYPMTLVATHCVFLTHLQCHDLQEFCPFGLRMG